MICFPQTTTSEIEAISYFKTRRFKSDLRILRIRQASYCLNDALKEGIRAFKEFGNAMKKVKFKREK